MRRFFARDARGPALAIRSAKNSGTSQGHAVDLNTISAIVPIERREEMGAWRPGTAWLAGGTWLFSEPQPDLDTLFDLSALNWTPLVMTSEALRVSATCTLADLNAFVPPLDYRAFDLIQVCCKALLGSFKVWNVATVGGNICLALPAAPMISLAVALEGEAVIWMPTGDERTMPVVDFVRDAQRTALAPGEVLRAIDLPVRAAKRLFAHRQVSLTPLGRSAALLIGTRDKTAFALTVTASTRRPFRLTFDQAPTPAQLADALTAAIARDMYHDDVHGRPEWRRHLTYSLAEEIRAELFEG
jgi:CO/xanthine dehydrogenase FAD-binding subunit